MFGAYTEIQILFFDEGVPTYAQDKDSKEWTMNVDSSFFAWALSLDQSYHLFN